MGTRSAEGQSLRRICQGPGGVPQLNRSPPRLGDLGGSLLARAVFLSKRGHRGRAYRFLRYTSQ